MWHMHMAQQTNMSPWDYINRPVESSYPYLLAESQNVDIKTYCQTASSMDYVLLQLQNLHAQKEINPDNDVLFVGMCRPTRTYTLDNDEGRYNFAFCKYSITMQSCGRLSIKIAFKPKYLPIP